MLFCSYLLLRQEREYHMWSYFASIFPSARWDVSISFAKDWRLLRIRRSPQHLKNHSWSRMAPKSLADIFYLYRYNISGKKNKNKNNKNKNKNNTNNRKIVEGVYLRRLDYFVHVSSHDQALTPSLPSATQRLLTVVRALGVWSLNLAWLGGNLKRKCLVFPSKYKRVFL